MFHKDFPPSFTTVLSFLSLLSAVACAEKAMESPFKIVSDE